MKNRIINLFHQLTLASKITAFAWFLFSLTSLTVYTLWQWIIACIVGEFIFVWPVQIISAKIKKKHREKPVQETKEYKRTLKEYEKALNNLGMLFVKALKENFFVDVRLLKCEEIDNAGYRIVFNVNSAEQLEYLMNNKDTIHNSLPGAPILNHLHGLIFEILVEKELNVTPYSKNEFNMKLDNGFDYMEGHEFESFCADILSKNNFQNVIVTKGSGDQGIDITAQKDGIRYGIQCKCYSSDIGNKAVQEAFAGKTFYNCHVAVVITNRHFTPSAKELAEKNGVLLWDREKLLELINNSKQ